MISSGIMEKSLFWRKIFLVLEIYKIQFVPEKNRIILEIKKPS
jgi:hypothetical protein